MCVCGEIKLSIKDFPSTRNVLHIANTHDSLPSLFLSLAFFLSSLSKSRLLLSRILLLAAAAAVTGALPRCSLSSPQLASLTAGRQRSSPAAHSLLLSCCSWSAAWLLPQLPAAAGSSSQGLVNRSVDLQIHTALGFGNRGGAATVGNSRNVVVGTLGIEEKEGINGVGLGNGVLASFVCLKVLTIFVLLDEQFWAKS
ncbi:hypothetical protein M9H77_19620 [Catharanthus roseus]|uniref:Uncharacterized protein n=1 Tax=Catharanthus roseus TaxID=4058 RepID=A0ACC0BAU2_CATRO|nr:hypothetical protein M9H77_19620 [Catharanthus roseus]